MYPGIYEMFPFIHDRKVVIVYLHNTRYSPDMIRTNINCRDIRVDLSQIGFCIKAQARQSQTKVQRILKINETGVCLAGNIKVEYVGVNLSTS